MHHNKNVVILGDIGGQTASLYNVLNELNVDSNTLKLPDDVVVIQVGDMVRMHPAFYEKNTRMVELVDTLTSVNKNRWIQIMGNHESGALGGAWCSHWAQKDECITNEAIAHLHDLWQDGRFYLAAGLIDEDEEYLITHAGLSHGYWQERLGKERELAKVVTSLNAFATKPFEEFTIPGHLGRADCADQRNADVLWADAVPELYTSWKVAQRQSPFIQIHGHSSPYNWRKDEWTTQLDWVRKTTKMGRGVSFTQVNKAWFIAVDWTLGNTTTDVTWPLMRFDNVRLVLA